MKKKYIEIGKIISTHALKGEVIVEGWCDDIILFSDLEFLYFDADGKEYKKIENVRYKKNNVLIMFDDIKTLEEAEKLKGKLIYVDRNDLNIKKDEILIQDLIGIKVCDYLNREICYGEIVDVIKTGANDVYVIKDTTENKKYIPVIKDVIKERDMDEEKIYIKVLEGLFDV